MKTVEFLLLLFLASAEPLEEGDSCNLSSGENGTCVPINDCAFAKEVLHPNMCLSEKLLACCIKTSSRKLREPGVLSAEKCKQYNLNLFGRKKVRKGVRVSGANRFPHMAAIGFVGDNNIQWLCGGSLISPNFILTAAHCLESTKFGKAKFVRLGDLDLANDNDAAEPQDFNVKRAIAHPEYKLRYNDIALIELDRRVRLTEYVSIACLDTRKEHNGAKMTLVGWGQTEYIGSPSSHLLQADFTVASHNSCRSAYARDLSRLPHGIIEDVHICAVGTNDQDSCQGDSGGPLQARNIEFVLDVHNIVGVTSFGKPCGLSKTPGVYTRVSNYLAWIESIVWPFS